MSYFESFFSDGKNRTAELDTVLQFLHVFLMYMFLKVILILDESSGHKITFLQELMKNCFNCPCLNFQLKLVKRGISRSVVIEETDFY